MKKRSLQQNWTKILNIDHKKQLTKNNLGWPRYKKFAGEFEKICKAEEIDIYYTVREA